MMIAMYSGTNLSKKMGRAYNDKAFASNKVERSK